MIREITIRIVSQTDRQVGADIVETGFNTYRRESIYCTYIDGSDIARVILKFFFIFVFESYYCY